MVLENMKYRDGGTKGCAGLTIKSDVARLGDRIGVAIRGVFGERPDFTGMTCSNERACHA